MSTESVVFRAIQVELLEYVDENTIDCREIPMGYFSAIFTMKNFLKNHGNNEGPCFYIIEEWALDPQHRGQCETDFCFSVYQYNKQFREIELYDKLLSKKFVYQYNRLDEQKDIVFRGRKEESLKVKKGESCWYYDKYEKRLYKGEVLSIPVYKDWKIPTLDWYDDSYMIKSGELDHTHISTPLVFSEKTFSNLSLGE